MKNLTQLLILAILAMSAMVACGKKKSDSGAAPVCSPTQVMQPGQYCNGGQMVQAQACNAMTQPPQGYMCVNGYLMPMNIPGGTANILNNVQMQNSYMMGMVNIGGTGNFDFNNPRIAYSYVGQITVQGTLQVLNQSLCGAPMGTYQITGTGQMSLGVISNLSLSITGATQMQLMVSSAVLENPQTGLDRNSNANRLGILLANLTVNGQPCGSITTY